jgi:hypothetical protein
MPDGLEPPFSYEEPMSAPHRSPTQQTFDPLTTAQSYVAAGLSVIPIARGTKEPDSSLLPRVWDEIAGKSKPSWRIFQERRPTAEELALVRAL